MTEVQSPDDAPLSDKRMNEESPVNDSRPEKAAEDSQWKVFVGGISRNTDENELFEIFRKYNPKEVMIMRELGTRRPRGFGFITLASQQDMEWAIEELHDTRINGRVVTVSKARPFENPKGDHDRSLRRNSPVRRDYSRRNDDRNRDYPRRYTPYHEHDNGNRPYDNRHRPYEALPQRRYGRGQDDNPHNNTHPSDSYPYRHDRGDYGGGDFEGRRGYRGSGPRDDYHHSREPVRQGSYMDYDRRQQMREREESRRWHPGDRERRHYNNHNGRDTNPRYRSPPLDDRRRDSARMVHPDNTKAHYGPDRRRGEVRRVEPYRHRSRTPDRRVR